MARPTPHLDKATALSDQLSAELELYGGELGAGGDLLSLLADVAMLEAHLAIAEALHGVVYVANANAV